MQIVTLKELDFETYAKDHEYASYYQTVEYGNVLKSMGFNVHYLGIKENDRLIGASLIVFKEIYMGKKIAYAPHGILFDYNNKEKVIELGKNLKRVFGKQGFMIFRMNPYIPATVKDKRGRTINVNKDINSIMKNIKSAGFKYMGQNKYFENELPRFEAIKLTDKPMNDIFKGLNKRIKHKIRRASGCGITILVDKEKKIDELYNFVKKKDIYSKKYLQAIVDNFNTSRLYYALLNTDSFVMEAKKRFEKEQETNNEYAKKIQNLRFANEKSRAKLLNKKMNSDKLLNVYKMDLVLATKLLEKYPKGLIIGGCLTVEYNNASYIVIDGYNKGLSHLNANYLIKWYILDDIEGRGLKYLNMNAVAGNFGNKNPYKNLNDSKLEYDTNIVEYIGEFNLILKKLNYLIYKRIKKENYQIKNDLKEKEEKKK